MKSPITLKKIIYKNYRCYYDGKRLLKIGKSSREVYLYKNMVIKIGGMYCLQSKTEIKFYERIRKSDQKYFPKLIAFDEKRGIVVQEYVPLVFDVNGNADRDTKKLVKTLITRYKLDGDVCHTEMRNWAINYQTSKPVIFDLGFS